MRDSLQLLCIIALGMAWIMFLINFARNLLRAGKKKRNNPEQDGEYQAWMDVFILFCLTALFDISSSDYVQSFVWTILK